jgi:hypothetical protein
MFGEAKG